MNTLMICLCIGQLACVLALVAMGVTAIRERNQMEDITISLIRYMEYHGLNAPTGEELEGFINQHEEDA